jgi:hypothetical protein
MGLISHYVTLHHAAKAYKEETPQLIGLTCKLQSKLSPWDP